MKDLPEGWVDVRLGDFAKTEKGKKPKVLSSERTEACPIPYVNIKAFEKNVIDEYTDGKGCVICEDDDFLMVWDGSRSGYVGKAIKGALGSTLVRIKFPNVNHDYAYFFLQSKFVEINTRAKGVGIPHVDPNLVWNYRFPLPPLPVQHAIVTKIEEIFSELDHGVEQLKTAQQQLKVYRQAVLNSAILGNAEHTIESVIASLDQGWSPKCYNEASRNNEEWAVIKTTAVQAGYFLDEENKKLPEDLEPRKQHELKQGDLLITRAGPRVRVGVCCLIKKTRSRLLNCDKVYRMRINPSKAIPEYIEILLNSPKYSKEVEKMKTGISDSGVNLTQKGFLKILIPLPPLSEQHQIVAEIERRLSVCDKLEETIVESLKAAEVLRAGVLKRAFEGQLV
ncbi:MAG: restriction endonuclease subunit S [Saprospiraceae bacterium]|nr:restriction endonuclease subunit S [Saprospiraceae bacterium]